MGGEPAGKSEDELGERVGTSRADLLAEHVL